MHITRAREEDLPAILSLQKLAYRSEAALLGRTDIPPLLQTLDELRAEHATGAVLKAEENGAIIGSVRARTEDGTLYIGKLMVHPRHRGKGLGTRLLQAAEEVLPHRRCELFTSSRSSANLRLYQGLGYRRFREQRQSEDLVFVYLEKEHCWEGAAQR